VKYGTKLIAVLAAWAYSGAHAQTVPQFRYSVTNNTALPLTCQMRTDGSPFEPVTFQPGAEWNNVAPAKDAIVRISCQLPVKQVLYPVIPGQRYRFLRRNANARIKLHREQTS
jgi:hypothetical protein